MDKETVEIVEIVEYYTFEGSLASPQLDFGILRFNIIDIWRLIQTFSIHTIA